MRQLYSGLLLLFILITSVPAWAQKLAIPFADSSWTKSYPPFRVAGNLYYVGTYDLSSYLITSEEGHILINTGLAGSVPLIRRNIETLGFRLSDVKILLTNQGHFDHVAGMAEIIKLTGARMMVHEGDAQVMSDGGASDYVFGGAPTFAPVTVDRLLHDGDTLEIGKTKVKLLHHPGHTKGASSFLVYTEDVNRKWTVLVANMPTILPSARIYGMPAYPDINGDFRKTLSALASVKFDLWVAAHASQFNLHSKREAGDPYRPEVFADQRGFDAAVRDYENEYQRRLQTDK